ncbi:MAG: hypothetical protein KF820_05775 [Candidatus Paracaedibacteraceae bacterium]|nr:hypothetical protein [Candidatus Paracaedibacteraceae bacterium]
MKFLFCVIFVFTTQAAELLTGQLDYEKYSNVVQERCRVSFSDNISLHLKEVSYTQDRNRLTLLRVIRPLNEGEVLVKSSKTILKDDQLFVVVGKLHLIEYNHPKSYQMPFMLDFLYVFEGNQGQGIGPKALSCLKDIVTILSQYSSFYRTIGLLSKDVDYHVGDQHVQLPKVPRRVDFYMKSGFHLHPEAIELIRFLDVGHMVRQMTVSRLADYMSYYLFKEESKSKLKTLAKTILPKLIDEYKIPLPLDFLIACVRYDGNESLFPILNRSYYREGISDAHQQLHPNFSYLMYWTVGQEPDQRGLNPQNYPVQPQEFLASIEVGEDYLLADQIRLNDSIILLKQSMPVKRGRPIGTKGMKRPLEFVDAFLTDESQSKRMCLEEARNLGLIVHTPFKDLDREQQGENLVHRGLEVDLGQ